MEYTLYILYSATLNKFYIGYTSLPIGERIRRHLSAHSGFTSQAMDWVLKYQEKYTDKSQAMEREKEIKHWKSRIKILTLINSSLGDNKSG